MIEITNLTKSFANKVVLQDINLSIPKGEVVAIIGPSGSGKSTLLRCINLLETPSIGSITINGLPNEDQISLNKIGMVFQHFNLFPHFTLLENLTYAPIQVLKQSKELARAAAITLLNTVGLSHKQNSYPHQLSGGEKQRAAIARTLIMQPEIILFDEPTSALDPEMVKEVLEVIKSLAHTGITILLVTHEMNFARDVADRILFFDQGQLVEDNIPGQFFLQPKCARAQLFLSKVA